MCFDFLLKFCLKYFSFETNSLRYHKYTQCSCTVPVIPVRFQWNLILLLADFRNILKYNINRIPPVVAQFHADGQTGLTQVIVFFRNFATTPKNGCVLADTGVTGYIRRGRPNCTNKFDLICVCVFSRRTRRFFCLGRGGRGGG